MDTVFKIIKNKKEFYLGASHFGYDDKTLKGSYYLIKYLFLKQDETTLNFLKNSFISFDGTNEQDIEVTINADLKTIYFESTLIIKEINNDINDIKKVSIKNEDLLFKNEYSIDEFLEFYNFFKDYEKEDYLIINNRLLLQINHS